MEYKFIEVIIMAEYCLDCWKKINGEKKDNNEYSLTEYLELCEGCGQWKRVVVKEKEYYDECEIYYSYIMLPFIILGGIISVLKRVLILIFLFVKNNVIKKIISLFTSPQNVVQYTQNNFLE